MQTPFLWSGISILPWCTGTGYNHFLQILLQRSKFHPLDITLTKHEVYLRSKLAMGAIGAARKTSSLPGHHLQDQLGMFTPYASRWQTFKCDCERLDDVSLVMALLANLSAPILESFDLRLSFCTDSQDGDAFRIFEGGAPKLSEVSIRGIHPSMCLLPLSSVSSLCLGAGLDEMSGDKFLDILQSLVTLTYLDLEGGVVSLEDLQLLGMEGKNVEIATLRSLSFAATASPQYCIGSILDTIRCPAVESMSISQLASWDVPEESPSTYTPPLPPITRLRFLKLIRIECHKLARHFNFSSLPALHTIVLHNCPSPMALDMLAVSIMMKIIKIKKHYLRCY